MLILALKVIPPVKDLSILLQVFSELEFHIGDHSLRVEKVEDGVTKDNGYYNLQIFSVGNKIEEFRSFMTPAILFFTIQKIFNIKRFMHT